jgi:hypothetical protein
MEFTDLGVSKRLKHRQKQVLFVFLGIFPDF